MHKITFSAFFLLATTLPIHSSEKAEQDKAKETKAAVNIKEYVDYPGQVEIPQQSSSRRTEENRSPNFPDFASAR